MKWQTKKLGEICKVIGGGTPKTNIPGYWNGNLCWVTPKDLSKKNSVFVSDTERKITSEGLKKSSAKLLPVGSVILSSRAPIGYVVINKVEMATNQGCRSFICRSEIFNKYLYYFLISNTKLLNSLGSGTTFKEISGSTLKEIEIPLPSISEQKKIVKILDKVFENIDKAKENTEKNLQNSKELFESYLENIFVNIENNWETKKLKEICDLQNGFAFKSKDYILSSNTMNFRMSQIRPNGTIDLNNNPKFLPDTYAEKYKQFLLDDGDIVVAMTDLATETKILGVPTIVKMNDKKLLLNQRVGRLIKIDCSQIDIPFLKYALTTPQVNNYYKSLGRGGLQINISKEQILNVDISFPSLSEQKQIVKKLGELSEQTKKLEENYEQKLLLLDELKKSVLQKAFSGNL